MSDCILLRFGEGRVLSATIITLGPSRFFRSGLENCLAEAGFQALSHALNLDEAVQDLNGRVPDIAAVGPNFPEPEAFAVCRELLRRWPEVKIILYTGHAADPLVLEDGFHTGIKAVLPREAGEAETITAIESALNGKSQYSRDIQNSRPASLAPREQDALALMAKGKTIKEIAHDLNLSYTTSRNYGQRVLEKLAIHERREAVRRGRRLG